MSRFQDIILRYTSAQPNAAPDVVADVMFLLDAYGKACDALDEMAAANAADLAEWKRTDADEEPEAQRPEEP